METYVCRKQEPKRDYLLRKIAQKLMTPSLNKFSMFSKIIYLSLVYQSPMILILLNLKCNIEILRFKAPNFIFPKIHSFQMFTVNQSRVRMLNVRKVIHTYLLNKVVNKCSLRCLESMKCNFDNFY